MTDLIYDYITMGVDLLIAAAIIAAIVILLRTTTVLNAYTANQQASSERINYYKEYNKYDCTDNLVSADVISAMLYYRHNIEIVVLTKDGGSDIVYTNKIKGGSINGSIYKIVGNSNPVEINPTEFRDALGSNAIYYGNLFEDNSNPGGYELKSGGTKGTISDEGYSGGVISGLMFTYRGYINGDQIVQLVDVPKNP